jgi:hypothetical protein
MRTRSVHTSMRPAIAALAVAIAPLAGCTRTEGVSSGDVPLNSTGGSFVVQCIDQKFVKLVSWQALPGYQAKVIVQGPSAEASLTFSSDSANDIRVAVRCVDAVPKVEEFVEEDNAVASMGDA